MNIKADVTRIVVQQLGVDASSVNEGASFLDDLGADSLAIVELVLAFEEHFDISIPESASNGIASVGDAIAYIEETLRSKPAALPEAPP